MAQSAAPEFGSTHAMARRDRNKRNNKGKGRADSSGARDDDPRAPEWAAPLRSRRFKAVGLRPLEDDEIAARLRGFDPELVFPHLPPAKRALAGELVRGARPIAVGPRQVIPDGRPTQPTLWAGLQPGVLFLALADDHEPQLWIPIEATPEAIAEKLEQYRPGRERSEPTKRLRLLLGLADDLAPIEDHYVGSPYTPTYPLLQGTLAGNPQRANGQLTSVFLGGFSGAVLTLDWVAVDLVRGCGPLVGTLTYAPRDDAAVVRAFNKHHRCGLPEDLPVDALGMIEMFPWHLSAADMKAQLETIDDDDLSMAVVTLFTLAAFDFDARAELLSAFVSHRKPVVVTALAHVAGMIEIPGLGERILATASSPARRAELEAALAGGEDEPGGDAGEDPDEDA